MKIVPDTNILVSSTFWDGDPRKILSLIDQKLVACILSQEILDEYQKVIVRDDIVEKIADKNLVASKIVERIMSNSTIVKITIHLDIVKNDANDNKIIECANAGNADYIITRDEHLLKLRKYENIKIVKPEEFLDIMKNEKE